MKNSGDAYLNSPSYGEVVQERLQGDAQAPRCFNVLNAHLRALEHVENKTCSTAFCNVKEQLHAELTGVLHKKSRYGRLPSHAHMSASGKSQSCS